MFIQLPARDTGRNLSDRFSIFAKIEITNDIQFLLPIMVAIMVSKWVGDFATHPLYHALLELKCIPFLDSEPVVFTHSGDKK